MIVILQHHSNSMKGGEKNGKEWGINKENEKKSQ